MAARVAPAVPVAWVPWEALRLPASPVVPVAQAEQVVWTMPVEPVEQVVWPLPVERAGLMRLVESAEPEAQVAREVLLLRVSRRRAVAWVPWEALVPRQRAEPSVAVELQVVAVQPVLVMQREAAGHEAVGVPRVPSHLEQPAELGHSEPLEHLVLLERSELQEQ